MEVKFSDFRNNFFEKLETKTGWGKEQIKTLFNDTYFEMLNETINWGDKMEPRTVEKIFTVKIKLNHDANRPLSESENWLKKTLRDEGYQVVDWGIKHGKHLKRN